MATRATLPLAVVDHCKSCARSRSCSFLGELKVFSKLVIILYEDLDQINT